MRSPFLSSTCISVKDSDWVTLRQSCINSTNEERDHIVVVARTRSLEGWVLDSSEVPIADAKISLSPQEQAFLSFPFALDMTRLVKRQGISDKVGRFQFERFPGCPGLRLRIFAEGFVGQSIDLDSVSWPLMIRLERPEEQDVVIIEGIVLDQRGLTLVNADVRLANNKTKSGPGGLFRLPLVESYIGDAAPLCASIPGHQAALLVNFGQRLKDQDNQIEPLELILGSEPLSIEGRVLDSEGRPCSGWVVSAVNETEVSQFWTPATTAEGLTRSSQKASMTDKEGHFVLTGLSDREYSLQAYQPRTLKCAKGTVKAGDQTAILRDESRTIAFLRGKLSSPTGDPVSNVSVTLNLKTTITATGFQTTNGDSTVTDEFGNFTFKNVPDRYIHIQYSGEGVLPGRYEFPECSEPVDQDIEIEVLRRCHFRIELGSVYPEATSGVLLDVEGKSLQVNSFQSVGMSGYPHAMISDGRSRVLAASETAVTLVLKNGEVELSRMPIHLDHEEVTVLRP
ncbi:MAG: hypothetical protein ACI8X5_002528 [Planctomycetota bacterium]|jgi:hypothetical protein